MVWSVRSSSVRWAVILLAILVLLALGCRYSRRALRSRRPLTPGGDGGGLDPLEMELLPGSSAGVSGGQVGEAGGGKSLGLCEGACRTDGDCRDFLRCHHASAGVPAPGCAGGGGRKLGQREYTKNRVPGDFVCVDPAALARTFRLRMEWEEQYGWQETDDEMWFCMQCDASCDVDARLEVGPCDEKAAVWQLSDMGGGAAREAHLRMAGSDLCAAVTLGMTPKTGPADNVLTLQPCDPLDSLQRFRPKNGDWEDARFELISANGGCITNDHWPKNGEDLYSWNCGHARWPNTSYWSKF